MRSPFRHLFGILRLLAWGPSHAWDQGFDHLDTNPSCRFHLAWLRNHHPLLLVLDLWDSTRLCRSSPDLVSSVSNIYSVLEVYTTIRTILLAVIATKSGHARWALLAFAVFDDFTKRRHTNRLFFTLLRAGWRGSLHNVTLLPATIHSSNLHRERSRVQDTADWRERAMVKRGHSIADVDDQQEASQ